eukprot:gnl/TRDRNA2_/TRDRNA2_136357_c0_seq1.p1 gnl/TRDRNA2_/TRDRNA2_136357_c0~~gnl/TRDRNA2_/TRDRNA2_136357_c0_seq1.p1  ORF type:complete len:516 (-),score=84.50 gnl/TRDRNA2_/TRDRNA2_136357_c0_seq1:163-1710(-)
MGSPTAAPAPNPVVNAEAAADAYYAGSATTASSSGVQLSEKQKLREKLTPDTQGVILVMVGLPARGKSFISRKIERFFQWKGFETRTFNVGKYRREATAPTESGKSDFYDAANSAAKAAREAAASAALDDAMGFLDNGGRIAIYDATNSSCSRREYIRERARSHHRSYSIIFVEVICDDRMIVETNMRNKVANSPDFKGVSIEEALLDLEKRVAKYEEVYQTVGDDEGSSIKLYNLSSKVMANHCYGRIAQSVLTYAMAIHVGARPIWLVRAGAGKGRDRLSSLSASGRDFAQSLALFTRERTEKYWKGIGKQSEPTYVVTSTMPRAIASVCYTTLKHEQNSALNPIDKGTVGAGWWDVECPGDTPPWDLLQKKNPAFWETLRADPLNRRFPGGESYKDVQRRLESLLVEIEMCTRPVLLVSHITVIQLLLAYFRGLPVEEAWNLPVPRDTIFENIPSLGGGFLHEALPLRPEDGGKRPVHEETVDEQAHSIQESLNKRPRTELQSVTTATHSSR